MTSEIVAPVFVIGTGRSGLTPLMHLVAYHPSFGWPSQYHSLFPKSYKWGILSRVLDFIPAGSKRKFSRVVPTHSEAWAMWHHCFYGFDEPFRDLTQADVTPYVKDRIQKAVLSILRYQGKKRFIAELSGWSRVRFLKEIFPDARFIHIVRDGRAVTNSLIHVNYWRGWQGIHNWRWGIPKTNYISLLEKYDYSFTAMAAVQWSMLVENIRLETTKLNSNDFLLIRYEDLVARPREETLRCTKFCGVEENLSRFERHLSMAIKTQIIDTNSVTHRIPPWRSNFSESDIKMLNEIMANELAQFGYN